jgi:hypothetical protein
MTEILFRCRDYHADGETIKLFCELDDRRHIDFNEWPHCIVTEEGEEYEVELRPKGIIDFGREYEGDRLWQTDLHELQIEMGVCVKVLCNGQPWTYEVVAVR